MTQRANLFLQIIIAPSLFINPVWARNGLLRPHLSVSGVFALPLGILPPQLLSKVFLF